jgi:hypothetical protein
MININNIILYQLDTNKYDNLYYNKYLKKIINNGENASNILEKFIEDDSMAAGGNPPAAIKHWHIHETQRMFSLLIEPGNNIYVIRLSDKLTDDLHIQFGYGVSPITLFSPGFSHEFINDCQLRNNKNCTVTDFINKSDKGLDGFNWVIFRIDRESVIDRLEAAAKLAKDKHDKDKYDDDHKHDSGHDRSTKEIGQFAIPFYFNLYDKYAGIPIWVLNDHEHWPNPIKPKFHGGAHPNSNGFLMLE